MTGRAWRRFALAEVVLMGTGVTQWHGARSLVAVLGICLALLLALDVGSRVQCSGWLRRGPMPPPPGSHLPPVQNESARARSLAALTAALTPEQRVLFEVTGYRVFTVYGERTGRRYDITNQEARGVIEWSPGARRRTWYCAVPTEPLPLYDVMLMQKLMIEGDERRFLRIANRRSP